MSKPTVYIWWAQTIKPKKPIDRIVHKYYSKADYSLLQKLFYHVHVTPILGLLLLIIEMPII
jgi:hypothetical protein